MIGFGVHVSIAGGLEKAVDRALERGCDVFQIFSRNPRSWRFNELSSYETSLFAKKLNSSGLSLAVDHMPYLPNLASPKVDVYQRSVKTLTVELCRCQELGIPYLVTHLGSHLGTGRLEGLHRIILAVEEALSQADNDVILLLENTSGSKNSMGSFFDEIAEIINELNSERLGVCLDTCHLFAAGYEFRTPESLEIMLEQIEETIGLEMLRLIHLNDSYGAKGSRIDRHQHIGLGQIGDQGFRVLLANNVVKNRPMILETPVDSQRNDVVNLKVARCLALESE